MSDLTLALCDEVSAMVRAAGALVDPEVYPKLRELGQTVRDEHEAMLAMADMNNRLMGEFDQLCENCRELMDVEVPT